MKGRKIMKVLVLTIAAGNGHNQTARAVADYLDSRGVEVKVVDSYRYFNTALSKLVENGYLLSSKYTPALFGRLYRVAEVHNSKDNIISLSKFTNSIVARQFAKFISQFNPDVIVCTHVFSATLVTKYKKKGLIDATLIGVLTDFTVHPFWEETNLDYYVCASELLKNQMEKKGIDADKALPFGIPIKEKFSSKIDKKKAREMLDIDDKYTIFVMTGSMGYGNVLKYVEQIDSLDGDFQIITVCGSNKSLKNSLDELPTNHLHYNYGYVDNVDVIMDASDCIVSKPGGLTMSEALAKKMNIILIDPIPGQEDRNVEFLLNNSLAVKVSDTFPIDEAIYQLMHNDERMKVLPELLDKAGKPNATKDLGEFIIGLDEN